MPKAVRLLIDTREWFDGIFGGIPIHKNHIFPVDRLSEEDVKSNRIINKPVYAIGSFPLLDVGPALDTYAERLVKCHRTKPLFAIVRGMGGGKTRAIEELYNRLLRKENLLAIEITYNRDWTPGENMHDIWEKVTDLRLFYSLSLVSRLLCMFYGMEMLDVQKRMQKKLSELERVSDTTATRRPEKLIQACVGHMVARVSQARVDTGREPVTKFILLMDETMASEEYMAKEFHLGKVQDYAGILRQALLNEPVYLSPAEPPIDISVLISSLKSSPIGATLSGRELCPIVLPPLLNSTQLVTLLWKQQSLEEGSNELYRFKLLASLHANRTGHQQRYQHTDANWRLV